MTNLKQVTLEVDELEVDHTNPLPVEAANDIQLQILHELKKLNLYLGLITDEQISDEDIERIEQ